MYNTKTSTINIILPDFFSSRQNRRCNEINDILTIECNSKWFIKVNKEPY